MSDDKQSTAVDPDGRPPEKPTVKIEAPPPWAVDLGKQVNSKLDAMGRRVEALEANLTTLVETTRSLQDRVGRGEAHLAEMDQWRARSSERAKAPSAADLANAAELASERSAREELAKELAAVKAMNVRQTEILEGLADGAKRLWARPEVRAVALAAWTSLVGWFASKGWMHQ